MKNFLRYCLLALSLAALCSCAADTVSDDADGFRSMIRLWMAHHEDEALNAQLMDAFAKYPGCCDEVWFEFDCIPGESQASMDEKAEKLKAAAERMRAAGIVVSTQVVAIGHPEGGGPFSNDPESLRTNKYGYRPVVSNTGYAATTQTCPRDTAFANFHARVYAHYCGAIKPYAVYIDDDLRAVSHNPAPVICFCDECLKLFSERTGTVWTRESLTKAIEANEPSDIRKEWVDFSQEGLAQYARTVSRAVHEVSPGTRMGYQDVAFHEMLFEGWDWKQILDAMREETGIEPVVRPGHGYYNDWTPRDMFTKAYGISRQIHRMPEYIRSFSPEIEGYLHKSTGKSPQGLCTETMLYLGIGANSMSYAIICGNNEPMEWYADNYFRYLDMYHGLFKGFVAFNKDSHPAGIGSYVSPNQINRNVHTMDRIAYSPHGSEIVGLAPLGVPFTPESPWCTATTLDGHAIEGMTEPEIDSLVNAGGVVMNAEAWAAFERRGHASRLKEVPGMGYETASGTRIAVLNNFGTDWTGAERNHILDLFDWVSGGRTYARIMSSVQANVIPRIDDDGQLRSLVYVNCCISDQENVELRLSGCPDVSRLVWHSAREGSVRLRPTKKDGDIYVTVPFVKAWDAGWMSVE